jgi:hypothetical protein
MEKNPSWSVPEKRRLQKFVKRATSQQSPAPSTPSSHQSELTSESTNNELDNRSERSRSSRLKGITNRLFGGGNSNSNAKKLQSGASQPPVYEIQTTTKAEMNTTEELFTEPVTDSVVPKPGIPSRDMNQELVIDNDADSSIPLTAESTENNESGHAQQVATQKDVDGMYRDDNDGIIAKGDRCCFFWFC